MNISFGSKVGPIQVRFFLTQKKKKKLDNQKNSRSWFLKNKI
jgi:hypothetical protein